MCIRDSDEMYPIMYLDAIVVKVRTDGHVRNRPVYIALAVDTEGRKHVLGLWLGKGDEGSKFWLSVLTELRNRGTDDVLVVCCDGLTGFGDAIEAVWPQAIVQTCVVHLIRNSMKYCSCLLYTSDAADDLTRVDLGGRRIIKKKK